VFFKTLKPFFDEVTTSGLAGKNHTRQKGDESAHVAQSRKSGYWKFLMTPALSCLSRGDYVTSQPLYLSDLARASFNISFLAVLGILGNFSCNLHLLPA
jgi:hypothetical protein